MKKNILITVLLVLVVVGGAYIFEQKNSTTDNQVIEIATSTEITTEAASSAAKKIVTPTSEVTDAKEKRYTQIKGVSFLVPDGMTQVNDSEFYARDDGSRGVAFRSSDYVTQILNAGMGNTPSEGIKTGTVLSVGFEPENLNANIQTSKAFAEFKNEISQDSSNVIKRDIIDVDGTPAFYAIYEDIEGVIGGWMEVSMYKNDELFSIKLKYGLDDSYENYQNQFSTIIKSIQLE